MHTRWWTAGCDIRVHAGKYWEISICILLCERGRKLVIQLHYKLKCNAMCNVDTYTLLAASHVLVSSQMQTAITKNNLDLSRPRHASSCRPYVSELTLFSSGHAIQSNDAHPIWGSATWARHCTFQLKMMVSKLHLGYTLRVLHFSTGVPNQTSFKPNCWGGWFYWITLSLL